MSMVEREKNSINNREMRRGRKKGNLVNENGWRRSIFLGEVKVPSFISPSFPIPIHFHRLLPAEEHVPFTWRSKVHVP
jgi:hypothetical protein